MASSDFANEVLCQKREASRTWLGDAGFKSRVSKGDVVDERTTNSEVVWLAYPSLVWGKALEVDGDFVRCCNNTGAGEVTI